MNATVRLHTAVLSVYKENCQELLKNFSGFWEFPRNN